MAGLLEQAQPAQQPQPAPPGNGQETPATPEEQEAYEQAAAVAVEIIHGSDSTHEGILEMLTGGEAPDALVSTTMLVLTEVDKKLDLPEVVIFELASTIFDLLVELGEKAGIFTLDEAQEKKIAGALTEMILQAYGAEAEDIQQFLGGVSDQEAASTLETYKEIAQ